MDLFNREIIGYSISKNIYNELVKSALLNAISRVNKIKYFIVIEDHNIEVKDIKICLMKIK